MSMYFLYGAIALIVVIYIYGTLIRRKIYREVDRLEDWKIDIMNRPITDEIGRVKGLKMSGQTEERFEAWRADWDNIVETKLPDIEETLFDIEEAANKYRFKKAKQLIALIDKELNGIEELLLQMLTDINGLVESEEQNRVEIDEIRALYTEVKKHYHTHRTSLGNCGQLLEERLDELYNAFSEFENATAEGNYLEAREILLTTAEQLEKQKQLIEETPLLLAQINQHIPEEINNLYSGIKEMEEAGYMLADFTFDGRIAEITRECEEIQGQIDKLELIGLEQRIELLTKQVESMYDDLELEVTAKRQVELVIVDLQEVLEKTYQTVDNLQREVDIVQQSYRISQEELQFHVEVSNKLASFTKRLRVIMDVTVNQKQSYTTIQALLTELQTDLNEFLQSIELFKGKLAMLREDEMKAKETLKQLKAKLQEGKRQVKKSNIPGLPTSVIDEMGKAEKKLLEANTKIAEIPLEMKAVNGKVSEALAHVDSSVDLIYDTIEKATLAEQLIQYGNRYRTRSEKVNVQLNEAELCFRNYYYDDAIELTTGIIEKFDSSIHDKVKKVVEEKV